VEDDHRPVFDEAAQERDNGGAGEPQRRLRDRPHDRERQEANERMC
jgi:hypothetical protein